MTQNLTRLERVSGVVLTPYAHLSDREFLIQMWAWLTTPEDELRYVTEHGLLLKWGYTPAPYAGEPIRWRARFETGREAEAFLRAEFDRRYARLKNVLPPRGDEAIPSGELDDALVKAIHERRAMLRQRYVKACDSRGPNTLKAAESAVVRRKRKTRVKHVAPRRKRSRRKT